MSINLDSTFTTYFDSEVKRKYEKQFSLKSTVNDKGVVKGSKVVFYKAGDGIATLHVPGSNVAYMNSSKSVVSADILDYDAFDFVDKSQINKVNFDEASLCADIASKAIGRRLNQIVINAGMATDQDVIGDATKSLSLDTLLEIKDTMDDNGIPEEDRYILWGSQQRSDLLKSVKVTSSEYVDVRSLVRGEIKQYLGFNFLVIPKMREGGLDIADMVQTGLAYHKEAIGFYNQKDFSTSTDWVTEKEGWKIGGSMGAACKIIDSDGVFKFKSLIKRDTTN